jgi:hypothetical protein
VASVGQGVEKPTARTNFPLPAKPSEAVIQGEAEGDRQSSSDSDSGSDIDPIRDVISSKVKPPEYQEADEGIEPGEPQARITVNSLLPYDAFLTLVQDVVLKAHTKKQPKQPASKPYNPLVDRPSFLRKVRGRCTSSIF